MEPIYIWSYIQLHYKLILFIHYFISSSNRIFVSHIEVPINCFFLLVGVMLIINSRSNIWWFEMPGRRELEKMEGATPGDRGYRQRWRY